MTTQNQIQQNIIEMTSDIITMTAITNQCKIKLFRKNEGW